MVSTTVILYNHGSNAMVVGKYTMELSRKTICFTYICTTSYNVPRISEFNPTTTTYRINHQFEFNYATTTCPKLELHHQTWPIHPMCQTQSNTWGYPSGPIAPIQTAYSIPKYPEDPSSSPRSPRSDTSTCSIERLWRRCLDMEQYRKNGELDQLKDALGRLRDDPKQMMDRRPQQGFYIPPPRPTPNQATCKRDQSQETKHPFQCHVLHRSTQKHPSRLEEVAQEEKKEHQIYKLSLRLQGNVF